MTTLHLKVFYPSRQSGSQLEQNLGVVPADERYAPFPMVILFNGINCGPELYQWLAVVAERGLVVVTFTWVAENLSGMITLTSGVDIARLRSGAYGRGPTASALPTLLGELERLQTTGILAGLLDLNRIVLGGHSAGGRVAIKSADLRYYGAIAASFAYGAHTAAAVQLGYVPARFSPCRTCGPCC